MKTLATFGHLTILQDSDDSIHVVDPNGFPIDQPWVPALKEAATLRGRLEAKLKEERKREEAQRRIEKAGSEFEAMVQEILGGTVEIVEGFPNLDLAQMLVQRVFGVSLYTPIRGRDAEYSKALKIKQVTCSRDYTAGFRQSVGRISDEGEGVWKVTLGNDVFETSMRMAYMLRLYLDTLQQDDPHRSPLLEAFRRALPDPPKHRLRTTRKLYVATYWRKQAAEELGEEAVKYVFPA